MKRFVTHAVLMMCVPVMAHAGMFGWVDSMFTFREEQKDRVAPRRVLPPKEVYVPTYDQRDHEAWSQYYTQPNLQAEDYLAGSGSKVMRAPEQPKPNVNTAGVAASPPPRGDEAWPEYAPYGDRAGENPNIVIGDPDATSEFVPSARLGIGTRVGPPVRDWRDGPVDGYGEVSRPGDYDYKSSPQQKYASPAVLDHALVEVPGRLGLTGRGMPLSDDGRVPGDMTTLSEDSHDSRYMARNAQGQVTRYKVQRGDSLGGIAAQEAIYGNWKLWPLIYSGNRKVIGRDPENLSVGSKLIIPRGYTPAQAREAERRAGKRD
jgi:nucleoid-associated protein YgaU